ncbi:PTS beta-glucoside transporter subunit IIBCA [Eubacterium sp. am_0171]|uniref:EIIBCA-Bgl n=1 Tax=Faecalicatena contorta TaxID=39482 RepID=A0A174J681_9FIRM|nr:MULTISPECIES: PTS transporter subunit IIBCA [Clostridia]MSC83781.1 PTS beta-glucoside transporter subunit IIBCA [Eubacterium sp. BIOML-A1]MSD06109.1 PTS beta-glucoside transporter subunit IIBCA [Eubacterium sp. BIOML-A2]RYT22243.1 PTS beta-glucoside transporter subunit IIBCA [Eubacterium sp. am_0171]CUO93138.1 EIIBCA-Bgl [[Eubacterium] contortum] [Faecalicatena contorta]
MDYHAIAEQILKYTGGKENLISAAHCATRLRLVIADNEKCDSAAVENVDAVKGVFFASGQMQIILGTGTVNKVYDEFIKIAGISEASKDDVKREAAKRQNPFKRLIKTIGDIFVPIIPAIVASGFLMGIMEALNFMVNNGYVNINTNGSIYQFAVLFSNVAYVFLPILIAFSAAKVFGANPFLGAVIGMIMIHPDLQNAWTVATEGVQKTQEVFFGLWRVDMVGYQGHVIPVIIAVFVLSIIEKRLHKIVPPMFDLFVTPLVSVFVTGYLTLAAIGPVFVFIENGLLNGIQSLLTLPFGIGSFIMGGAYATTVVSGIHHMYTVIDIGQLAQYGLTFWLPLASAANVAQGGAAFAVALKSKNKKMKSVALPSALSACMGITEPAIFGVNLRLGKPFIAASIGGACGALYASLVHLGATGTGVTGIFGILLHLHSPLHYVIAMAIAFGVAFVLTGILGFKEEPASVKSGQVETVMEEAQETEDGNNGELILASPLKGRVIPLSEVPDETFASGVLGDGVGIQPAEGKVYAPFDCTVAAVFDTKHAIGLETSDGVELLIHIGMDTVKLNGEPFTVYVEAGETVKAGGLLVEFDMDKIKAAGLDTVTPVIVTDPGKYKSIKITGRQS